MDTITDVMMCLDEEINELQQSVAKTKSKLHDLEQKLYAKEQARKEVENLIGRKTNGKEEKDEPSKKTAVDFLTEVLSERGEPMHIQEIIRRAQEHGYEYSGKREDGPLISLGHVLRNNKMFQRTGRGYFQLKH